MEAATVNMEALDRHLSELLGPVQGRALVEVLIERARQDRKWGVQNHAPAVWMLILGEEVGEVAQDTLASCKPDDTPLRKRILQLSDAGVMCELDLQKRGCDELNGWTRPMNDRERECYRKELVQVAASAVAAIECLDRETAALQPPPTTATREKDGGGHG